MDYKIADSPFMSPAKRDGNPVFYTRWEELVSKEINPAIAKYQNFLKKEYLDAARDEISILSLPRGKECYQAYIRNFTSTNKTGDEIFRLGEKSSRRMK